MTKEILLAYGLQANASTTPFGAGLINHTWKVEDESGTYILQKINTTVFKNPRFISDNIQAIGNWLAKEHPSYFFCMPCTTISGDCLVQVNEDHFRMFPFVKNTHSLTVVNNTAQAFEAAKKFGEFTKLLAQFPAQQLKITLPHFHDLSLRYAQLQSSVANGNQQRVEQAAELLAFLSEQKNIVSDFESLSTSGGFKQRVTHHDTKISNVLFDDKDKAVCVIDLDTVMPGYFISDVGDMMRTYLSPAGEEEKDLSKIKLREDYFEAIAEGYLGELHAQLTGAEIQHFIFAGKFMIYMQALRFLTDHFNNDSYYGSAYEGHNYYRAINQAHLLNLLNEKEQKLGFIVSNIMKRYY